MITELVRERLALPEGGPDAGLVSPGGLDQDCAADCCRYAAPAARPDGASRA
jgi:hypothetical protein